MEGEEKNVNRQDEIIIIQLANLFHSLCISLSHSNGRSVRYFACTVRMYIRGGPKTSGGLNRHRVYGVAAYTHIRNIGVHACRSR